MVRLEQLPISGTGEGPELQSRHAGITIHDRGGARGAAGGDHSRGRYRGAGWVRGGHRDREDRGLEGIDDSGGGHRPPGQHRGHALPPVRRAGDGRGRRVLLRRRRRRGAVGRRGIVAGRSPPQAP
jgi:hypothetical protein